MFGWLKRKRKKQNAEPVMRKQDRNAGPVHVRRWDAAQTDRLNRDMWASAHGYSINYDLSLDLETLRARSTFECANNPMVEGVINTHAVDVVGKCGPSLQVQSDDAEFNELVEDAFAEFFEMPDPTGRLSGPEMLKLWVRLLWVAGEFINQEVTVDRGQTGLTSLGVTCIHPRLLTTPPHMAGDPNVLFGIRTRDGKPVTYYFQREADPTVYNIVTEHTPVPADMIQHRFMVTEPHQARGYPWLASSLQVIADLRDYKKHVMTAARNAAAQGVFWYADHPDADYLQVNEVVEIQHGMQQTGPPGWKPAMMQPTQPTSEFKTYVHERLRELGRPVNMPLMMVLLSSADSNFSSAHYDGQIYIRGIQSLQSYIERLCLNLFLKKLVRELQLSRRVTPPRRYNPMWTWPVPPYVNPKQMYEALRGQLEDGTAAYSDVLGAYGRNLEETIRKRQRENEMLAEADLPPLPTGRKATSDAAPEVSVTPEGD